MKPDSLSSSSDLPPSGSPTDERKPRSSSRPDSGTGYVSNVDELIQNTPLSLVLMHYGLQPPQNSTGEYRMKCVFNETCSDSQYGNLTVRQDVAKQIYCHSCETRGNLLTLIHGLETHQPPSSGRLRGQEFKAAVQKLRQINGEVTAAQPQRTYKTPSEMKQQRREYESKPLPDSSSGRSPDRASSLPIPVLAGLPTEPVTRRLRQAPNQSHPSNSSTHRSSATRKKPPAISPISIKT